MSDNFRFFFGLTLSLPAFAISTPHQQQYQEANEERNVTHQLSNNEIVPDCHSETHCIGLLFTRFYRIFSTKWNVIGQHL